MKKMLGLCGVACLLLSFSVKTGDGTNIINTAKISANHGSHISIASSGNNGVSIHASSISADHGSSINIGNGDDVVFIFAGLSVFGAVLALGSKLFSKRSKVLEKEKYQIRRDVSLYKQYKEYDASGVQDSLDSAYFNCMDSINKGFSFDTTLMGERETQAQRMLKEIKSLKWLCAKKHLEFFKIALPKYPEQTKLAYDNATRYKKWYKNSWWPGFILLWLGCRKPDSQKFNELKMQYRYVKHTQWVR